MWWQQFLEGLGDLVAGLGRNVARFYAETRVGATRKLFFINPIVPNDLDTDGLGGADLRIWIVPTLAVPPDGLTITFQRLGGGTPGLSALLYIGVDDGIYPVGTPPAHMQFAFFGFETQPGKVAPQELKLAFRQPSQTDLTAELSITNAPAPAIVRGGLMTSPVTVEPATGVPFGSAIRTGSLFAATDLTDARLSIGPLTGTTVNLASPVTVKVASTPSTTAVRYLAPELLDLSADVRIHGQTDQRILFSTARMPRGVAVTLAAPELLIHPDASLVAEVRGVGLPLPASFTCATVRFALPGRPLRVAWGPTPVLLDVGLPPGDGTSTGGDLAVSVNAHLLAGQRAVESLGPPPRPRQALAVEYIEDKELWAAVNALGRVHVSRRQTGTLTAADASLTLLDPLPDGSASPPPRSLRLSVYTGGRLTADVRAARIEADQPSGSAATLSASAHLDDGLTDVKITGGLRYLRALYDDGAARNEAWTVATPRRLAVTYDNKDGLKFDLVPDAAMSVTADRRARDVSAALAGFGRIFARLLVNAPVHSTQTTVPRQPLLQGTAAVGTFADHHLDTAGTDFPPEVEGMSLRYESGQNKGQTRVITAAAPGELWTAYFEHTPAPGDRFTIVSTDLSVKATDALARPSTRRGISAVVSAAGGADRRLATRIHPQVVQQTALRLEPPVSPLPGHEHEAVAARIEGVLSVAMPPPTRSGRGALAVDIQLDPGRPRRSIRYAENRRWVLPDEVRDALVLGIPSEPQPIPHVRALLAEAPDSLHLHQDFAAGATSYTLGRTGGGGRGWVWALSEQLRHDRALAGVGVISLDLVTIPAGLTLILADDLPDVRRHTEPKDIMWTWSLGWRRPESQAVAVSGDLRVERVVYASFWPGQEPLSPNSGTQSYPGLDKDQWDLTTATFAHLHDAGLADQRFTVWTLDGNDWYDPDRKAGIAVEASGLGADLDLDRYRVLLPPQVRGFSNIKWIKTTEIQLKEYVGGWVLSGQHGLPIPTPDYERPNEDVGLWFLRAINKIPGIGDAYFGNTGGNVNGRDRPYP
ncbi:hypothetical protein [Microbispora hainanensis]|uniref:hypothetical protein n=1 Tax=Microbispora hainanensis TaxID=568844 RepID=UPI00324D5A96